ncbi:hypothetical protein FIBSPDRAFT_965689 [Athelia psychrophila]|uniref:Vps72/YL1 C-terminal domain-containing protein n=1 Tax=Athelia psychrophila TaxID=1759441 RepID=A0A167XMD3_9AGAM|nr:hypothetical protein FIBSPDRAFT_965689 [Fibularhizoctonia sp. CBS 109695]
MLGFDNLTQDVEDDKDFFVKKEEEDIFGSDLAGADEETALVGVNAGEKGADEEEQRARKAKGGTTGQRKGDRKCDEKRLTISETASRLKTAAQRRKTVLVQKTYTLSKLLVHVHALDTEEGNILEHKSYLAAEEEESAEKPSLEASIADLIGADVPRADLKVCNGKARPVCTMLIALLISADLTSAPDTNLPRTGLPAPYLDPRTGVPFANVPAREVLSLILSHEYVWSAGLGCCIAWEGEQMPKSLQADESNGDAGTDLGDVATDTGKGMAVRTLLLISRVYPPRNTSIAPFASTAVGSKPSFVYTVSSISTKPAQVVWALASALPSGASPDAKLMQHVDSGICTLDLTFPISSNWSGFISAPLTESLPPCYAPSTTLTTTRAGDPAHKRYVRIVNHDILCTIGFLGLLPLAQWTQTFTTH